MGLYPGQQKESVHRILAKKGWRNFEGDVLERFFWTN